LDISLPILRPGRDAGRVVLEVLNLKMNLARSLSHCRGQIYGVGITPGSVRIRNAKEIRMERRRVHQSGNKVGEEFFHSCSDF
jgi:hypothetical protein